MRRRYITGIDGMLDVERVIEDVEKCRIIRFAVEKAKKLDIQRKLC